MEYITQEVLDDIRIKKDLMKQYKCRTYYELKTLLGKEQIESLVEKTLREENSNLHITK